MCKYIKEVAVMDGIIKDPTPYGFNNGSSLGMGGGDDNDPSPSPSQEEDEREC